MIPVPRSTPYTQKVERESCEEFPATLWSGNGTGSLSPGLARERKDALGGTNVERGGGRYRAVSSPFHSRFTRTHDDDMMMIIIIIMEGG